MLEKDEEKSKKTKPRSKKRNKDNNNMESDRTKLDEWIIKQYLKTLNSICSNSDKFDLIFTLASIYSDKMKEAQSSGNTNILGEFIAELADKVTKVENQFSNLEDRV